MTFDQFRKIAIENANIEDVSKHGDNEYETKVAVIFKGGNKVYYYDGSYADILRKLGVAVWTKNEYKSAKSHLAMIESMGGRTLFGISENSLREIEQWRKVVNDMENGIII